MRILIVEDDDVSRKFLYKFLSKYGDCDLTVDGMEALDAVSLSYKDNEPYELICLDIMMPKLDGIKTLKAIREIERRNNIHTSKQSKIIITTALNDIDTVKVTYEEDCDAFAVKPINTKKFLEVLEKLELIEKTKI